MRKLFYQLALSTALITGAAAVAQAECYSKTVSTDNTASFQLAQAGGSGGGTVGGAGSSAGNSSGTSGTGAGSSTGTSTNSTSGGGAATVIPQNERMRQPTTPGTPPQPGIGQTNR
jgi:hypothetical protein